MSKEYRNIVMIKDINIYLAIINLALKNGKKPGDDMTEEFEEMMKKYPDRFKVIGKTTMDADMITGELRERGNKIINMNEIQRQKDLNNKNE